MESKTLTWYIADQPSDRYAEDKEEAKSAKMKLRHHRHQTIRGG
jgi:hypothetical protein